MVFRERDSSDSSYVLFRDLRRVSLHTYGNVSETLKA